MEQRWTVDRYDMPSGDLEFWAMRRGKIPHAVNRDDGKRGRMMMRVSLAAAVAVAMSALLT
jgi:hypothetical protein